jgi:hypothetical protein
MSYNIDRWKTKKLEGLTIPLAAFYKHPRKDWHPKQPILTDPEAGAVELRCGCEQHIKGVLKDGRLMVTEFDMTGEGSGTFYRDILEPALKESVGTLEAVLIWEGGDSVNRLMVKDGKVETEDIEL